MDASTIFQIIKNKNKEEILFKYCDFNDFEDLRLFSLYLLNKSTNTICESPKRFTYMSTHEEKQTEDAIKNNLTNIKIDDVRYDTCELGYRISNPLEGIKNSIGVFGCSYTFGIGIPYDKTYTHLLQERLGVPVYNFGIPGSGIQKITKSFCSINGFYKLKTAIFVLPSLYRYEFLKEEGDYFIQEDLIPNYPPYTLKKTYELLYSEFGDVTFFNEYIKHIHLIKLNAKIHGTKVYFTTWCGVTLDLLKKYNVDYFEPAKIRFLESERSHSGEKINDFARDGMHPGLKSHELTCDELYNMIKNRPKKLL